MLNDLAEAIRRWTEKKKHGPKHQAHPGAVPFPHHESLKPKENGSTHRVTWEPYTTLRLGGLIVEFSAKKEHKA